MRTAFASPTRFLALVVCFTIASCTNKTEHHIADQHGVRVDITDIGVDRPSGGSYVQLQDHSGTHSLQIIIDDAEARAITLELRGVKPPRPLSDDLLRSVIRQTGNNVDRVEITDMRDEIYYARIFLDHDRYAIDSRPSDAIALAVGEGVPIYVAPGLMQTEQTARFKMSPPPIVGVAIGITVQELGDDLAAYFGVAPHTGVVVADFDATAQRAGLRRGDIITAVAGHGVTTPDGFTHATNAATDRTVALTILRAGRIAVIAVPSPRATVSSHQ